MNFAQKTDQVDVFHALNEFHQQSFGIQMDFFSVRRLYPYYEQRFQNFSRLMKYVPDLQTTMFEEIKHWGAYALNKLSTNAAGRNGKWCNSKANVVAWRCRSS